MSATSVKVPEYVTSVGTWLEDEANVALVEKLQKLTHARDVLLRQEEVVNYLDFQKKLRPQVEKIPHFWPYTLNTSTTVASNCAFEKDIDALNYLTDIEWVVDPRDYRPYDLIFHFAENPYFTNKTLTKSFVLQTGPKQGLTASELIGRPKPDGVGALPEELIAAINEVQTAEEREAKHTIEPAPQGEAWDLETVKKSLADENLVEQLATFNDSEDLLGLPMAIDWKSKEVDLCTLMPRFGQTEELDVEDLEGDGGSFFWAFEEPHDADGLMAIIATDIVPNCIQYFFNEGGDCEQAEEDMDDDSDDDDAEIDLEDSEDEADAAEAQPAKKKAKLA